MLEKIKQVRLFFDTFFFEERTKRKKLKCLTFMGMIAMLMQIFLIT